MANASKLEYSIFLRFSVSPTRDATHKQRVVVVMITDPVVVNTSSTDQPSDQIFFTRTSTKFYASGSDRAGRPQLQTAPKSSIPIQPAQIDGLGLPSTSCSGQLRRCCYLTKSSPWPHNDECRLGDHDFTAQYWRRRETRVSGTSADTYATACQSHSDDGAPAHLPQTFSRSSAYAETDRRSRCPQRLQMIQFSWIST